LHEQGFGDLSAGVSFGRCGKVGKKAKRAGTYAPFSHPTTILRDAAEVGYQGRLFYGDQNGDSSSFLTRIRQTLAQVSALITTYEVAGKSVDDTLTVVEDALGKFRDAIASLTFRSILERRRASFDVARIETSKSKKTRIMA
jgi:hypothetical protein